MTVQSISFTKPAEFLNLNGRAHWRVRYVLSKAWRQTAWAFASEARLQPMGRSLVSVDLPVQSIKVRRDPGNWAPTVKPIVDGLVDAGVWPDDHSGFVVTEEPKFHVGDELVIVTLTELAP